jgi:hypothetical protein
MLAEARLAALEKGKMDKSSQGDEVRATFQISGTVERDGAQAYIWATHVHLPGGWHLSDVAVAMSTLMHDIADRYDWSHDDFMDAVLKDFVQTKEY